MNEQVRALSEMVARSGIPVDDKVAAIPMTDGAIVYVLNGPLDDMVRDWYQHYTRKLASIGLRLVLHGFDWKGQYVYVSDKEEEPDD